MIFDSDPAVRAGLDKDYGLRNDAAHNYKSLPKEARAVSAWLGSLEDLVEKF